MNNFLHKRHQLWYFSNGGIYWDKTNRARYYCQGKNLYNKETRNCSFGFIPFNICKKHYNYNLNKTNKHLFLYRSGTTYAAFKDLSAQYKNIESTSETNSILSQLRTTKIRKTNSYSDYKNETTNFDEFESSSIIKNKIKSNKTDVDINDKNNDPNFAKNFQNVYNLYSRAQLDADIFVNATNENNSKDIFSNILFNQNEMYDINFMNMRGYISEIKRKLHDQINKIDIRDILHIFNMIFFTRTIFTYDFDNYDFIYQELEYDDLRNIFILSYLRSFSKDENQTFFDFTCRIKRSYSRRPFCYNCNTPLEIILEKFKTLFELDKKYNVFENLNNFLENKIKEEELFNEIILKKSEFYDENQFIRIIYDFYNNSNNKNNTLKEMCYTYLFYLVCLYSFNYGIVNNNFMPNKQNKDINNDKYHINNFQNNESVFNNEIKINVFAENNIIDKRMNILQNIIQHIFENIDINKELYLCIDKNKKNFREPKIVFPILCILQNLVQKGNNVEYYRICNIQNFNLLMNVIKEKFENIYKYSIIKEIEKEMDPEYFNENLMSNDYKNNIFKTFIRTFDYDRYRDVSVRGFSNYLISSLINQFNVEDLPGSYPSNDVFRKISYINNTIEILCEINLSILKLSKWHDTNIIKQNTQRQLSNEYIKFRPLSDLDFHRNAYQIEIVPFLYTITSNVFTNAAPFSIYIKPQNNEFSYFNRKKLNENGTFDILQNYIYKIFKLLIEKNKDGNVYEPTLIYNTFFNFLKCVTNTLTAEVYYNINNNYRYNDIHDFKIWELIYNDNSLREYFISVLENLHAHILEIMDILHSYNNDKTIEIVDDTYDYVAKIYTLRNIFYSLISIDNKFLHKMLYKENLFKFNEDIVKKEKSKCCNKYLVHAIKYCALNLEQMAFQNDRVINYYNNLTFDKDFYISNDYEEILNFKLNNIKRSINSIYSYFKKEDVDKLKDINLINIIESDVFEKSIFDCQQKLSDLNLFDDEIKICDDYEIYAMETKQLYFIRCCLEDSNNCTSIFNFVSYGFLMLMIVLNNKKMFNQYRNYLINFLNMMASWYENGCFDYYLFSKIWFNLMMLINLETVDIDKLHGQYEKINYFNNGRIDDITKKRLNMVSVLPPNLYFVPNINNYTFNNSEILTKALYGSYDINYVSQTYFLLYTYILLFKKIYGKENLFVYLNKFDKEGSLILNKACEKFRLGI